MSLPRSFTSSITRKTQGTIIVALLLLLAVLYFILHTVVSRSFDTVERRYADQAIENTVGALSDQLSLLDRSVADYSIWDDTYAFLNGDLDTYVGSNFTDGMFETNQLDLVLIINNDGSPAFGRILGPEGDLTPAEQDAVFAAIRAAGALTELPPDAARHTVVLAPLWPLMISSHQVLRSDASGPSAGVFIMGRWIDEELAAELSERLRLDVAFRRLDRGLPASIPAEALDLAQNPTGSVTAPLDADRLGSYSVITNIDGRPMVMVQITNDRPIWATGQQTILVTLGVFIVAGVFFIISISLLLDQIVLARLRRLIEGVHLIGARQDLGQRVDLDGSDELGQLAETINETMDAIERADHDRRRAEEQREAMWQELVRSRRGFIATVSHELRTPLTPIRGYADMMMQGVAGELSEDQRDFVMAIHQNALRMEMMIGDLLVIGQLEAGQVQIDQEPLHIEAVVRSVLTMLGQAIEGGQLRVTLRLAESLPRIYADPYRVEQILANLLSNAIKYTPAGGQIRVGARPIDEQFLEISVSDTGIGMSAKEQEQLFTPFYRAEGAIRRQIQGTGLGLSIVHSLVRLHGGTAEVSSAPGEGSAFRITLPIYVEQPSSSLAAAERPGDNQARTVAS